MVNLALRGTTGVNRESPWVVLFYFRAQGPVYSSLECKLRNVRST